MLKSPFPIIIIVKLSTKIKKRKKRRRRCINHLYKYIIIFFKNLERSLAKFNT